MLFKKSLTLIGLLSFSVIFDCGSPSTALSEDSRAYSQPKHFSARLKISGKKLKRMREISQKFRGDHAAADQTTITIPTKDGLVQIQVIPQELFAPRAQVTVSGHGGRQKRIRLEDPEIFTGVPTTGVTTDFARLSVVRNSKSGALSLSGTLTQGSDFYKIETKRAAAIESDEAAAATVSISQIDVSDLNAELSKCGAALGADGRLLGSTFPSGAIAAQATANLATLVELTIGTEADKSFVDSFGSVERARNTIVDLVNLADGVYRRDLGITLKIGLQNFWTTTTTYETGLDRTNQNYGHVLLGAFSSYWGNNFSPATYGNGYAYLFTSSLPTFQGLSLAGVNGGSACGGYGLGLANSVSGTELPAMIFAHELGHSFGAGHDPGCGSNGPWIMCEQAPSNLVEFSDASKNSISTNLPYLSCLKPTSIPWGNSPNPPAISASDSLYPALVRVTWVPASSGKPAASFKLFRTVDSFAPPCSGTPYASGLTSRVFDDSAVQDGITYYYFMKAVGLDGVESDCSAPNFGSTKPAKPTITSQPQSVTVNAGDPVTLTVSASGVWLSYTWQRNGKAVGPTTGLPNYNFTATQADDQAKYTVLVKNMSGSVKSLPAILNVGAGTHLLSVKANTFHANPRRPRVGKPIDFVATLRNDGSRAETGISATVRVKQGSTVVASASKTLTTIKAHANGLLKFLDMWQPNAAGTYTAELCYGATSIPGAPACQSVSVNVPS